MTYNDDYVFLFIPCTLVYNDMIFIIMICVFILVWLYIESNNNNEQHTTTN